MVTNKKLFVVTKYIWANSVSEVLKTEKKTAPDDVYIDVDWRKGNPSVGEKRLGFNKK